MNFIKLAAVLGLLLFASTAMSQDFYMYNESGQQRQLPMQDSLVTVKLVSPFETFSGLFIAEAALDGTFQPKRLTNGFYLLKVKDGYSTFELLQRLRERSDILFANPTFVDPLGSPIYVTETFFASFFPSVSQSQIDSMNAVHSVSIVDSLYGDPYYLILRVSGSSDLDIVAMSNSYHESELVRFAKPSVIIGLSLMADPNDPYWQYQWNFKNTGQTGGTTDADIDLDLAYEYFIQATGSVLVAVLDDGFTGHEDFPQSRIISGFDYAEQDFDVSPGPNAFHGMSCVGQIAASGYNNIGIAGIALYARILGQKIIRDNLEFIIDDANLSLAFSDAVLAGARVINNSWGCKPGVVDCGYLMDTTTYWISKADSAGVLVVFASGNDGASIKWPANVASVFTVGGTDHRDKVQPESNFGAKLDIVAPTGLASYGFGNVWSLDQTGFLGANPNYVTCAPSDPNYFCKFGGTSAACAQASGVAAMVLQRRPDLVGNTQLLKEILRHSSEDQVGDSFDTPGWDQFYGWGRLNAARALSSVTRGDANNDGIININDATYIMNYVMVPGWPPPIPTLKSGDPDGNCIVTISDAVYLISYIFAGGPAPRIGYCY